MSIPVVPWWPPVGFTTMTEPKIQQFSAHPRTVIPPVMRDFGRRSRECVADDPIREDCVTIGQLVGKRPGNAVLMHGLIVASIEIS